MFTRINTKAIGLGAAIVLAASSLGACSRSDTASTTTPPETTTTTSPGTAPTTSPETTIATTTTLSDNASAAVVSEDVVAETAAGELSVEEQDAILMMREEEKLAHDVYVTLFDMWDLRIFENIAASETTHTEAVATLIDQYGLDDPADGNDIGVFTNPDFTALYDELIEQGSESLVEALAVGAFIEDLDIVDLERLLEVVDTPAIATVFESLLKGSRNHMRAFTSQLESRGETYTPEFLTQDQYEAIISTPTERGRA